MSFQANRSDGLQSWMPTRVDYSRNTSLIQIDMNDKGVAIFKINRPDKRNTLSQKTISALVSAFKLVTYDPKVKVIVLTGSDSLGPFSAGADLSELQHLTTAEAHRSHYLQDLCTCISSLRIPIIACVAGFALGGGFELAMMCDIIYSTDDAKFGLPELSIGTFPGMGGTQRLTRALGKSKAMDMILTSSTVSGKELRRLGLVAQTWSQDDLLMKTMAAAHKIAGLSVPIVEMAKAAILTAEQTDLDAGLKYERSLYYSSLSLEDRAEGMAAFNEKRTPAFKNK